ncbi:unnamed protein product [Thlaspi arvense]|uniref:Uncharacterized protein n=1 Tax=Thlaspi arvense TaxID=13288 RepID=A0AAU9SBU1_THLAR|nr:unnamed protein product [Thlaspi arvense]
MLFSFNMQFHLIHDTCYKCWRNFWFKITNIAFRESEFVKCSVSDDEETKRVARVSFVQLMLEWVSRFSGEAIESFELSLSKPVGFETEINSLIEFVVPKPVKNLVLDILDRSWITNNEAATKAILVQLPACFYNLTSLESLKLFACGFDPSRLTKPGTLKLLSFGWIQLKNIMSYISRTPILESLSMQNCWDVGLEEITRDNSRLRELVFENCDLATTYSTLDLPNIQIFKIMEEAYLDFGAETEYDEETGTLLCGLLYNLLSAKKLTFCPFLIQLIQDGEDNASINGNTTSGNEDKYASQLMINSCLDLETLTFQMVAPRSVSTTTSGIDPETYWRFEINLWVLKEDVEGCGVEELQWKLFLIRCGRVLERVDLCFPCRVEESQRMLALAAVEKIGTTFKTASERLRIFVHNS